MDDIAIINHLEHKYNLVISSGMLEIILQAIGHRELSPFFEDMIEISGRDITSDIPQAILLPVEELLVGEKMILCQRL